MGLGCSTLENLERNSALSRLCGTDAISPNDPVWNTLFSHYISPPFNQTEDCLLDSSVESLKEQILINNLQTRNFSALVKVFAARAFELKSSVQTSDSLFLWQTYNAMFLIRNILKVFVSSLSDDQVSQQLICEVSGRDVEGNLGEQDPQAILIGALVHIITELPITGTTYMLHLEAVNTITVFLSSQMFVGKPSSKLSAYRIIMNNQQTIPITAALLNNFIDQMEPPHPIPGKDEYGSFVVGMANGLWRMFKRNVFGEEDPEMADLKEQSLASHSLYLLLILINHCPDTDGDSNLNSYRQNFANFGNIAASTVREDIPPGPDEPFVSFRVNYGRLYEIICDQINKDSTTLLLYALVHRNSSFKSYIMARSDIELLVLPILQTLYNSPTSASRHIYMSLIVILILSEEDLFNQQVHDITVKNIVWYTERNITELSLGGLIILVVIRTIHYNILRSRDKYLHTNCLATLANMSSKFRCMHPYVAQRLISLFETLAKRQMKLSLRFHQDDPNDKDYDEAQTIQDLKVLEEVLRMILEIYNSTLVYQLPQNRHFVYSLLYKKDLFESFASIPITQELVFNLDVVIVYFTKWLGSDHGDLSVAEVMERIEEGILHWKPDILRKFPELKFKYVEEDKHEEFFIPYVWCIIFRKAGIYWSPIQLSLFDVATDLD